MATFLAYITIREHTWYLSLHQVLCVFLCGTVTLGISVQIFGLLLLLARVDSVLKQFYRVALNNLLKLFFFFLKQLIVLAKCKY